MEEIIFEQRGFLEKRRFTIKEEGIYYFVNDIDSQGSRFIEYDHFIGITRLHTALKPIFLRIGLLVLTCVILNAFSFPVSKGMIIMTLFLAGIALILIGIYFIFQRHYTVLLLDDSLQILIIRNKHNMKMHDEIVNTINARVRDYMRKTYYLIFDKENPYYTLSRLQWLYHHNFIDSSELQTMSTKLDINCDDGKDCPPLYLQDLV
ncbi:MAG: hypothetical protein Ta2G_10660 [Termitinemataceae bacterium]|nr:MAG: hypothetical protein Ta2G_10660 [Termitinemataceae bacterium]